MDVATPNSRDSLELHAESLDPEPNQPSIGRGGSAPPATGAGSAQRAAGVALHSPLKRAVLRIGFSGSGHIGYVGRPRTQVFEGCPDSAHALPQPTDRLKTP